MFTAISYISAHWFLILSVVGGTAGLVAFAWFTKNWKAAVAALLLVVAGLAYQSADLGGYKRALDEQKAAEIETLKKRLLTVAMITEADAQRALADQYAISQLKKLASETPINTAPCLDAASVGRVRAIGPLQLPGEAPKRPRRHSSVLPVRSGAP